MKLKTTYQSVSVATLLLCVLSGCSDSSSVPSPKTEGHELVLRAYSGNLASQEAVAGSVCFAKGSESGKYTEIWEAFVASDGKVGWKTPKYYPHDDSPVFLCGFAPVGELSEEGEGDISYRIDGSQDIQVTLEQPGSLTDMFWQTNKSFEFVHLLSQLRFRVCCDETGEMNGWKLTQLLAEGVQSEVRLSLAERSLSFSGEPGEMSVDMKPLPLGQEWSDVSGVIMLQPGVPVSLTAVVEDSRGVETRFEHLPVAFAEEGGLPLAGTSYLLSVTLRGEGGSSLSARVAEWKRGNNGTGVID